MFLYFLRVQYIEYVYPARPTVPRERLVAALEDDGEVAEILPLLEMGRVGKGLTASSAAARPLKLPVAGWHADGRMAGVSTHRALDRRRTRSSVAGSPPQLGSI